MLIARSHILKSAVVVYLLITTAIPCCLFSLLQIVESSTDTFSLDKSLTGEAKDEVIILSIERLLEKDSPQLETMKMQVRQLGAGCGC